MQPRISRTMLKISRRCQILQLQFQEVDIELCWTEVSGRTSCTGITIKYTRQIANFVINSAGALRAFDSREENSTTTGHLGGLLQSSTYLAGLSGGGWLVGSIFVNNYTTISNLLRRPLKTSSVWEFGNSIFKGPANNGSSLLDISRYFDDIYQAVTDKAKAGFQTSITDYWGRALSYQLIDATDGGPSYTWSSIAKEQNFATGDTPLPLLVADGRAPGETVISTNSTVFEFSPWEFGTFDPTIFGFAPLQFVGSNFSNGALPSGQKCVRGFDNAGYVMGTSSSLFNAFLLNIDSSAVPDIAKKFVTKILQTFNQTNNDIADYSPNPFYGYHNITNLGSQSGRLTLVDGGEDLQNIPLHPLIQPTRLVDVIFAVDSSADTNYFWPNGTSLVATYERSRNKISNGTSFPAVPDVNTFVNLGLNARPTFFGCNSSNTTSQTPLVVYIPNAPYVYFSNVSTYDPTYNNSERDAIVANGYAVATLGNGTVDSQWPTCVGCAILSRSLERTKTSVPEVCQQCFKKYCWDGTVNSTSPAPYQPKIALAAINVKSSGTRERIQISLFSGFGIAMLTISILGLWTAVGRAIVDGKTYSNLLLEPWSLLPVLAAILPWFCIENLFVSSVDHWFFFSRYNDTLVPGGGRGILILDLLEYVFIS